MSIRPVKTRKVGRKVVCGNCGTKVILDRGGEAVCPNPSCWTNAGSPTHGLIYSRSALKHIPVQGDKHYSGSRGEKIEVSGSHSKPRISNWLRYPR